MEGQESEREKRNLTIATIEVLATQFAGTA